jgi:hypothetical protein
LPSEDEINEKKSRGVDPYLEFMHMSKQRKELKKFKSKQRSIFLFRKTPY